MTSDEYENGQHECIDLANAYKAIMQCDEFPLDLNHTELFGRVHNSGIKIGCQYQFNVGDDRAYYEGYATGKEFGKDYGILDGLKFVGDACKFVCGQTSPDMQLDEPVFKYYINCVREVYKAGFDVGSIGDTSWFKE